MPSIDVTDVLLDPMIAGESFSVIRRAEIVNDYGESVQTTQTIPNVVGSVVPLGSNSLLREEAFQTNDKTIRVLTSFRLRGPSKSAVLQNYQPDIIVWKGDNFVVRTLEDYTQYGAGMVDAECSSIDLVDQAPT